MYIVSEKGNFTQDDPKVEREYKVDLVNDGDVETIARTFLGGLINVAGVLVWYPPDIDATGLRCVAVDWSIDYQGEGAGNPSVYPGFAMMTVSYGVPENQTADTGKISVTLGGDALQLDGGQYTWTSGSKNGKKLGTGDVKPFKIVPSAQIKVEFKSKPSVDFASLGSLNGAINSGTFIINGFPQPIADQCARYDGAEAGRKMTSDGLDYYEITHSFAINFNGWNNIFDGAAYSTVTPPIYPQIVDFNGIFDL